MGQQLAGSLSEQLFEILRDWIITGRLRQGEKIDVQRLSDEFGASPTPIRDALLRCAEKGLVNVHPRVGYFVVDLSEQDINEIFNLRKLFEIHALETGIQCIEAQDLVFLREQLHMVELEIEKNAYRARFDETDVRLHSLIIDASDNSRLVAYAYQIHDHVDMIRRMTDLIERGLEDHLAIVDALLAKDLPKARSLLSDHIDRSRDGAIASIHAARASAS